MNLMAKNYILWLKFDDFIPLNHLFIILCGKICETVWLLGNQKLFASFRYFTGIVRTTAPHK